MKFYQVSCAALATVLLLGSVGCKTAQSNTSSETALLATASEASNPLPTECEPEHAASETIAVETVDKKTEKPASATKKAVAATEKNKQESTQNKKTEQSKETVYFKTNKYSVVLTELDNQYTDEMQYIEIEDYVFIFGSSNTFKVRQNGSFLSVPAAYEQGIMSKIELKQLYDAFPAKWKMPLKEYLLTEKVCSQERTFTYPTNPKVNYCDDTVTVTLGKELSKKKYNFTVEDFANAGVQNIASVKNVVWPNGEVQFVYLTLKETGLENVTKAIQSISKLPGVRCAEPDAWDTAEAID